MARDKVEPSGQDRAKQDTKSEAGAVLGGQIHSSDFSETSHQGLSRVTDSRNERWQPRQDRKLGRSVVGRSVGPLSSRSDLLPGRARRHY